MLNGMDASSVTACLNKYNGISFRFTSHCPPIPQAIGFVKQSLYLPPAGRHMAS